jgi:lysophospholipase L1-like esterase
MKKSIFLALLFTAFFSAIKAQQNLPYWNEVQGLKKKDSIKFPAPNQILMIGSSSFTKWTDVQDYFSSYPMLNRAFGGSSLPDLIRYRYDILYPYQPKQILIYCGENDFAANDTVSVPTVVNRFKTLFELLRARYSTIPVAYVSMKPSPSRLRLLPKYIEANAIIKDFLAGKPKTVFIDVYSKMLNADGSVMADIFVEDNLHMNAKGYAIWKKVLLPYLVKK